MPLSNIHRCKILHIFMIVIHCSPAPVAFLGRVLALDVRGAVICVVLHLILPVLDVLWPIIEIANIRHFQVHVDHEGQPRLGIDAEHVSFIDLLQNVVLDVLVFLPGLNSQELVELILNLVLVVAANELHVA